MKIKIIDSSSKQPLINTKIQLQIKGANSGIITVTTDMVGMAQIDQRYEGQQITSPQGGGMGPWVTACEHAVLLIPAKQKVTETR